MTMLKHGDYAGTEALAREGECLVGEAVQPIPA
jgi:hypothetical protein